MSDGNGTQGTVIKRGDGASPETFSNIGGITTVSGFTEERTMIDVTTLADTVEKMKAGLTVIAELTLSYIIDETDNEQTGLRADMRAGTLRHFQIVMTDSPATTIEFSALVRSMGPAFERDDVVRGSIVLKPSHVLPTYS